MTDTGAVRLSLPLQGENVSPPCPCLCGGTYQLGYQVGSPMFWHSWPTCLDFDRIDTLEEAAAFSQRCRHAQGDYRSSEEPS